MIKQEPEIETVLLRGTISNLERSRRSHDFVLTQVQRQNIGATAVGAAVMGMGATGIGLIGMAANSDEEADWVQFELDGKQMQGWLWMMPMRNGDEVEVVAERVEGNRYVAYAVKRDGDDLLAVYPHAIAGRHEHRRRMTRIMLWFFGFCYLGTSAMFLFAGGGVGKNPLTTLSFLVASGFFLFLIFGILFYRASRKLMGFVYLAEAIFRTYGWPNVRNIDLRKTSRDNRRANSLPNFGRYYFRYK